MKQTLILLSALMLIVSCGTAKKATKTEAAPAAAAVAVADNAPKKIKVKGTVKFNDPKFKMNIVKQDGFDKVIIGTFDIKPDGTFEYEMEVKEPGVYTLDCIKWESLSFWAEDEDIEVDFRGKDTAKMVIKRPLHHQIKNAGPLNEVMNIINYIGYRNYELMIEFSQAAYRMKELSQDDKQKFSTGLYDILGVDFSDRILNVVENFGDRKSVLVAIGQLNQVKHKDAIAKAIANLEQKYPNYKPVADFKKKMLDAEAQRNRLAIGRPAPEFTFPNPDGKMVSLSDFKGKFLVIDFWASWCGPCRLEIPHVKEVYAKYKDKGVEVLSVSIDKKESDWRKAMTEENMTWPQLLAPGAGKDLMKDYQFSGIPYIILLDKDGKILAKGLRGKEIDKALDAALGIK